MLALRPLALLWVLEIDANLARLNRRFSCIACRTRVRAPHRGTPFRGTPVENSLLLGKLHA